MSGSNRGHSIIRYTSTGGTIPRTARSSNDILAKTTVYALCVAIVFVLLAGVGSAANNTAPVLNPISTVIINETETATIVLTASDDDGDSVTYSTNASFGNLSGDTFTWITDYGDSGSYNIEFEVSDGNLTDTEIGIIDVGNTNRAPILDPISTVQVSETETATIVLTSSDLDGDEVTYSKNVAYGILSGDTFTWTTGHDDSGIYNIEFTVSDGTLTDTEIGIIDVGNTNRAPILDPISTVQVSETETATIVLTSSDLDGDEVTYSKNVAYGILSGDTFTWTTGHDDSGIYNIEFTVSDGTLTDTEIGIIEVGNTNRAPVLDTIPTVQINETETATIVLSASDPDDDTITYSTNATFGVFTNNTFTWASGYDDYGIYYLKFTVSDGTLTDTEIGVIVVGDADRAPVLDHIGDRSVDENTELSFTLNASDADGDILTYSAVDLPNGSTLNSSTGFFAWTPTHEQVKTVIFRVKGKALEDSENVTITVNDVNTAVTPPSSGGGGGGGGGSTGEEFDNIEVRDVIRVYINKGSNITYEFKEELNAIDFVRFDAKTSAGYIAATIEVLKDTSALVSTPPSGEVYQNMNIWVGNAGYATEDKITNPTIEFKVARTWIAENNINQYKIQLCRYSSGVWEQLPTTKKYEDVKYIYFTSNTSGFSSFAITGIKSSNFMANTMALNMPEKDTPTTYFSTPSTPTDDTINSDEVKSEIDVLHEEAKSSRGLIFILLSIGIVAIIILIYIRRDSSWDMP